MKDLSVLLVGDAQFTRTLEEMLLPTYPGSVRSVSPPDLVESCTAECPRLVIVDADTVARDDILAVIALREQEEYAATSIVMIATDGYTFPPFRDAFVLFKAVTRDILLRKVREAVPELERRHVRLPFFAPVTLRDSNGVSFGMTRDLSIGGVFVATFDQIPALDSEIRLSFPLDGEVIETVGRVAWYNSKKKPQNVLLPEGFGVEFRMMNANYSQSIRNHVTRTTGE